MAGRGNAYVAVLVIDLHFPDAASLKARRRELAPLLTHLRGRLGLTVSEVDHQDTWQRARLVAAITSGSLGRLEAGADRVERWLEASCPQGVRVQRIVTSLEDLGA